MTDRARNTGVLALATAIALAGCEVPLGAETPTGDVLQGVWVACLNDGAGDYSRALAFYPDASFSVTTRTHATTDRTCAGTQSVTSYEAWRYRLGLEAPALVGPDGTEVLARKIDIWDALVRVYSIVYLDSHVTPARLYFGDLAFDPARDGTDPEKRPDVLSASTALTGN